MATQHQSVTQLCAMLEGANVQLALDAAMDLMRIAMVRFEIRFDSKVPLRWSSMT